MNMILHGIDAPNVVHTNTLTENKQFDNLAAGSTVRNLNTELVRRVTVPLPPLSEQRRIVAVLDGKPISGNQMVEKLFGELPQFFKDEDELRKIWSRPDTRKALMASLTEKGFGFEQLAEVGRLINAEKSDVFDVLAYVAYAMAPITRQERVDSHKGGIFARYDAKLQAFLDFVMAQYVKQGVEELDLAKVEKLLELKYHTVDDAVGQLGSAPLISDAFVDFQQYLYVPQDQ